MCFRLVRLTTTQGSAAQVVAYAIDSPAPPFPVLVMAYAINGFGLGLQDAGANGYVASYKHGAATKMGILHAVYGLLDLLFLGNI